jgi:hypothetical protein
MARMSRGACGASACSKAANVVGSHICQPVPASALGTTRHGARRSPRGVETAASGAGSGPRRHRGGCALASCAPRPDAPSARSRTASVGPGGRGRRDVRTAAAPAAFHRGGPDRVEVHAVPESSVARGLGDVSEPRDVDVAVWRRIAARSGAIEDDRMYSILAAELLDQGGVKFHDLPIFASGTSAAQRRRGASARWVSLLAPEGMGGVGLRPPDCHCRCS